LPQESDDIPDVAGYFRKEAVRKIAAPHLDPWLLEVIVGIVRKVSILVALGLFWSTCDKKPLATVYTPIGRQSACLRAWMTSEITTARL
jgi:hypothetical protein